MALSNVYFVMQSIKLLVPNKQFSQWNNCIEAFLVGANNDKHSPALHSTAQQPDTPEFESYVTTRLYIESTRPNVSMH